MRAIAYPVNSPDHNKNKAKLSMAWRISIALCLIFIVLSTVIDDNLNGLNSYLYAITVSILGMLYLVWKKNPDYLFIAYAVLGSSIAHISYWNNPANIHYADFIWITICCFMSFLGNSRITGILLIVANAVGIGLFIFLRYNVDAYVVAATTQTQLYGIYLEILFAFLIMACLFYHFVAFQRIWEKAYKDSNNKIRAQNAENITLLKEIHHRVKNNLQIIVSLLRLQKHELTSIESKQQFQEAINRVMVMSSIHKKLYQQERLTELNLDRYIKELVQELIELYNLKLKVTADIECKMEAIDLKTMVPVGLLINELVSNSFKYAFTTKSEAHISIQINETNSGFNLSYKDNGKWVNSSTEGGFGMELIEIFTEQLNGKRTLETTESGTSYLFNLKLADT